MSLDRLRKKHAAALAKPAEIEAQEAGAINKLRARIHQANSGGASATSRVEITRICNLPSVFPLTSDEIEEFCRDRVLAKAYNEGFRLLPAQANGLMEYEEYGGVFGPIGVGQGKTLLTLMIANHAYQKGLRRMMLLVPPEVLVQLVHDIKFARTKVPINYPIHILGGKKMRERRALARSGKKGLYVFPYSLLSTQDTSDNLNDIRPEIIIGDEAHRISNPTAARTRRMTAYIDEHEPECVFVSGTITSKSVMEYYHLIRASLGNNNPLPNTKSLAYEWAAVIDAGGESSWDDSSHNNPGPLKPLVEWARTNYPELEITEDRKGFREAYKVRLISCPGVVSSGDSDIGTSLMFVNKPVEGKEQAEGWEKLKELIDQIEDQWLTPNEDEIEHAIHMWKWLNELSAGFYNQLVWPDVESFSKRRSMGAKQAQEILVKALKHHTAGQDYARVLREWLERHARPNLDTPFLLGQDMARNEGKNVGSELFDAWSYWKSLDFEGRPDRDSHAIRVCPYKVDAAIRWASSIDAGGIIWYHHKAIGEWLYEKATEAGLDAIHCPAGHNTQILDPKNVDRIVIASITAHGTGKNLQHFKDQCILQMPRSAKTAEQLLGRLHRTGQKADELEVVTMNTLPFDEFNFAACLNDALYIHQTTGVSQKLIYGGYSPIPKTFPPAVLRQRGAENVKELTAEQQRMMKDKFG